MNKDKLVAEMLTAKAEKNNTIDLDAYSNGLADMFDKLVNLCNLPVVSNNEVAVCRYCKQPISINGKCTNIACGNWLSKG